MRDVERYKLLHGPYEPPKVRRGDTLLCEIRGTVKTGGYSGGPIPWPRLLKTGKHALIITAELARAVRCESVLAITHHWCVNEVTVWSWRKALGVPQINEGTGRLYRDYQPEKLPEDVAAAGRDKIGTPEVRAKISRGKTGRPVADTVRAGLLRAAKRRKRKPHRESIAAGGRAHHAKAWAKRRPAAWAEMARVAVAARAAAPAPSRGRPWLPEEVALLGLAPDSIVAATLRRTRPSATLARHNRGIAAWAVPSMTPPGG